MNMLKKGPELKMPDVKVPGFLYDIYYDLRERHLLPLVAILLVALVALPFVLGGGSSESEPAEAESAIAATSSAVPSSELVVARAAPGLRDYHRRLKDEHPKDPFIQQYSHSKEGGSASEGAGGVEESSSVSVESSETTTETTEIDTPGEEDGGAPPEEGRLRYYSYAIDVSVVPVSSGTGGKKPDATVRHKLPDMTMLPSREVPALTFIGVTKDAKKAVMLVSDKVTGLFGDGVCIVGAEACQLIALEPGLPETVVYGADNRTYRIEIVKLQLLKTDELNVAPLGPPKKHKSS